MKEQIYALKNKLAVAEDALARHRTEPKEVARLQTEFNYLSESLRLKDLRIIQLEEDLAEAECSLRDLVSKHRAHDQTWRTTDSSQVDFYRDKVEELTTELDSVQSQLRLNTDRSQERPKTDGTEPTQQLLRKEEALRTANKRFQQQQRKLDLIEQSMKQLEAKNKLLESDRKKFLGKWQSSVSRTKGDDRLKARLKELEGALQELNQENLELKSTVKSLQDKLDVRENEHKLEDDKYAKVVEGFQKVKLKQRLDEDDREILERMNQDLSIKLSQVEAALEDCKTRLEVSETVRINTQHAVPMLMERKRSEKRESVTSLIEKLARESEKPLLSLRGDDEDEQTAGPKLTRLNQQPSLRSLSRMRRTQTPSPFEQRYKY
jgi:chromosome segregation ATPase